MRRVLVAAAFAGVAFAHLLSLPHALVEADTYLHMAVGRLVAQGTIPRADPFTFTTGGAPWVAHEWLSGWAFHVLHGFGGMGFLVWAVTAAGVLAVVLAGLASEGSATGQLVAGAVALLLIGSTYCVRPHVLALVWLAGTARAVRAFVRSGRRRNLAVAVLLVWLWANTHGSFVLAGAVFAAGFLELAREAQPHRRARDLAAAAALALVACCSNPYGPALLVLPFRFVENRALLQTIAEWRAPTWAECPWQMGLTGLVLAVVAARWRRMSAGDALLVLVAYLLWASARRNVVLVGVLAAPVLGRVLPGAGNPLRFVECMVGTALALALAFPFTVLREVQHPFQFSRACAFAIKTAPGQGRVFNDGELGGYLIWELGPEHPVFVDWRAELFRDSPVIAQYNQVLEGAAGWDSVLSFYRVEWVFVQRGRAVVRLLEGHPGWIEVCGDPAHVLFRRRHAI